MASCPVSMRRRCGRELARNFVRKLRAKLGGDSQSLNVQRAMQ